MNMASAIPLSQPALLDTRPYFCHQCSHQWMKLAAAIFQCPRCNEGFIEEVTGDFQPRPASPELSAGVFSLLSNISRLTNSLVSPTAPNRSSSRNQATGSRGSRASTRNNSPGSHSTLSIVVGTTNRAGANDGSPNNNENGINRDIRIRFGVGRGAGFFSFPIDDVMNTIFSAGPRQPAMTDNQLEEIPKALITAEDTAAQVQCAICFDDYAQDEMDVRKLPCNHLFHEKCIFPWLKSNATCPVCRARMPNANAENEDDNSDMDEDMFEEISRIIDFPIMERAQQQGNRNRRRQTNRPRSPLIPLINPVGLHPRSPQNNNNNNNNNDDDEDLFSNGVQTRSQRQATASTSNGSSLQVVHSSRALFRPLPSPPRTNTGSHRTLLASLMLNSGRQGLNEARRTQRVAHENRLRRVPASTSLHEQGNNNNEPSTSSRGAVESISRTLNTARVGTSSGSLSSRMRQLVRENSERTVVNHHPPSGAPRNSGAIASRTRSHQITQPTTSTAATAAPQLAARSVTSRRGRGRPPQRNQNSESVEGVNYEPPRRRVRIQEESDSD